MAFSNNISVAWTRRNYSVNGTQIPSNFIVVIFIENERMCTSTYLLTLDWEQLPKLMFVFYGENFIYIILSFIHF